MKLTKYNNDSRTPQSIEIGSIVFTVQVIIINSIIACEYLVCKWPATL